MTRVKLERWNVHTISDLAKVPVGELRAEFGKSGVYLHEAAQGRDDSPIVTESKPKSISEENTFERDTRAMAEVEKYIVDMSAGVARTLEHEGFIARTIVLKLRYGDFVTITRQAPLRAPTADVGEIRACALRLLGAHWDRKKPLRLVGVGAHNLIEATSARQMEMML